MRTGPSADRCSRHRRQTISYGSPVPSVNTNQQKISRAKRRMARRVRSSTPPTSQRLVRLPIGPTPRRSVDASPFRADPCGDMRAATTASWQPPKPTVATDRSIALELNPASRQESQGTACQTSTNGGQHVASRRRSALSVIHVYCRFVIFRRRAMPHPCS